MYELCEGEQKSIFPQAHAIAIHTFILSARLINAIKQYKYPNICP
jgi:hypothetical protein